MSSNTSLNSFQKQIRGLDADQKTLLKSLGRTERRALRDYTDITGKPIGAVLSGAIDNGVGLDIERRLHDRREGVFRSEYRVNDSDRYSQFDENGDQDFISVDLRSPRFPSRPDIYDRILIDSDQPIEIQKGQGSRHGSMVFKHTEHGRDLVAVVFHEEGTALNISSLSGTSEIFVN